MHHEENIYDEDFEITEIFDDIIDQSGSYDIAEAEFRMRLADEPELRRAYKTWCHHTGSTEKHGFSDYCEERIEAQGDIWETLHNDYD